MSQMAINSAMHAALNHHQAGRLSEAEQLYRQVLQAMPNHPEALHYLGVLAGQASQPDAAADLIRRAIALRPQELNFHLNLAKIFLDCGRFDDAIAAYSQALKLAPNSAQTHQYLGLAQLGRGLTEDAIASFRQALLLNPQLQDARNNLGHALHTLGQLDQAAAVLGEALTLQPGFAPAHVNLGLVHMARGDLDEAIACFHQALKLQPRMAQPHNNLGNALKDSGLIDDAVAAFRAALALHPNDPPSHSNLLFALHMHPAMDAKTLLAEHQAWNAKFAAPLQAAIKPHPNVRSPNRRLRIGYISPDLRQHAIGRFLHPLLAAHDPAAVEVFCYSDVPVEDAMTAQLRAAADHWRPIVGLTDDMVAQQVRSDAIDILVDLSMHAAGNRLLVFARKPAPVQVTYLSYCSTTGMPAMDFRLSDPHLDPPGTDDCYVERTIRLPQTYWCYQPPPEASEVASLPALANRGITFGALNNFGKTSDGALQAWCAVLRAVEGSTLLLHAHAGSHRQRVLCAAQECGVDSGRIAFVGHSPLAEYFAAYSRIDIALDPFPYAGGTTTCDALWMGVPVITLAGRTAVGRGGVSILSNLGMTQFIAPDVETYVRRAAELAADLDQLAHLRANLRARMRQSPLMDAPSFARAVESAYRQMWTPWCTRPDAAP